MATKKGGKKAAKKAAPKSSVKKTGPLPYDTMGNSTPKSSKKK